MKRLLTLVSAIFALSLTTFAQYKVGDYYCADGKEGVVFEVTHNGQHGKIVSLYQSEEPMAWATDDFCDILIGAVSKSNGRANTDIIFRVRDFRSKYPIFAWCADLGPGWYIPSIEELAVICRVRAMINPTLGQYGDPVSGYYWSSTEAPDTSYGGDDSAKLYRVASDAYEHIMRKHYTVTGGQEVNVRAVATF